MELKVKGKFVTSSKVKIFQNSQKYIFGYHDALKIYGAPKLCTETTVSNQPVVFFLVKYQKLLKVEIFQHIGKNR